MRTIKIRIKDSKDYKILKHYIFSTRHFENILLIMLNQYEEDFSLLSDYQVMRAVLRDNEGGQVRDEVNYIKEKY